MYLQSPLRCVSGVTGSNLKKGIHAILAGRVAGELNLAKKATLLTGVVWALAIPIVFGMMNASPSSSWQNSTRPANTPKFEVVSIKPCRPADRGGGGNRVENGGRMSPGTLNLPCGPLENLIRNAYLSFADGQRNSMLWSVPIEGGPAWIRSDFYEINAKSDNTARHEMMLGPMLKVLLEERFKLKIHRATRQVPVYELTVAKNGPKLQQFKEGRCISADPSNPPPPIQPGQQPTRICGGNLLRSNGRKRTYDFYAMSIDQFSELLRGTLLRPIINKTKIPGKFDFHIEFAAEETTPGELTQGANEPTGSSIFTALQEQLGLKLESAKGPGEYLVIDNVERPTEN